MKTSDGSKAQGWTWDAALCGIVPPMISPLNETGELDGDALKVLIEHILGGGCSGLFILGGCGEGAWLTSGQRASVVRGTVWAAAGRVPVLVGVMLPATGPAMEAARQAADEGADALVVGSPYYLGVDAAAQQRHVEAILGAVSLPVLLYNIPQATHNPLAPATVARLGSGSSNPGDQGLGGRLRGVPGVPGHQEAAGRLPGVAGERALRVGQPAPGRRRVGPRHGEFRAGPLRGPAPRRGERRCRRPARDLQEAITDLCTLHTHGHWLPALKAACAMLGLGNGVPSPPLLPATEEQRRTIRAILVRHDLLAS